MTRTRSLVTLITMLIAASLAFLPEAAAKSGDKKLAFGRIKLVAESGDNIDLENPGVFKSGDLFLMWVLPASGDKATRLQVDESGDFFWELEPGDYYIASFEWSRDAGGAAAGGVFIGNRLWADFSVSADSDATYIGTFAVAETSKRQYNITVEDESDIAPEWLAKHDENLSIEFTSSVMTLEDERWKNTGIPICFPPLGVTCDKRREGVEAVTPKQTASTVFRKIKTLTPTLEWKPSTTEGVFYDVIVYEAYYQKMGFLSGGGKPGGGYEPGRVVEYQEGLTEPRYELQTPLEKGKRYYWSVRIRHQNLVTSWSTRRVDTMEGLRMVSKYRELYGMRPPAPRKRR